MNYYPWGWGPLPPPPQQHHNPSKRNMQREIDKAVNRQLRLLGQPRRDKQKKKEEKRKTAAKMRGEFFTFIEIFVLGLWAAPILGYAFKILQTHYGLP